MAGTRTAAWLLAAMTVAIPTDAQDAARVLVESQAAYARGDYAAATKLLLPLADAPGLSDAERARVHASLATVHVDSGRLAEALASADRAETFARATGDRALAVRLTIIRGTVARNRGALVDAVSRYRESLAVAEQLGDRGLAASAHIALSSAFNVLGDWGRVLYHADRAYQADPQPTDQRRLSYHVSRGIAFYEFRDRRSSEQAFREALAIAQRLGDRRNESFALGELGLVYWEFDRDRERALSHYASAIELARTAGVPLLESTWITNRGNVYRDAGETAEALRQYREALEIERRPGMGRNLPVILKNTGQTLRQRGERDEADRHLREALDLADRQGQARIQWQARMELGELYRDRDPGRAARYFQESLERLEAQHSNVLLENFRAGALSRSLDAYDPYDLYVDLLLDRGDARAAFFVAERARARAFLDSLSLSREQIRDEIPADVLAAENGALARISAQQASLRGGTLSDEARHAALAAIEKAEGELNEARLRLATERPSLAHARYPRIVQADALQREVLRAGDTLIMFFVGRAGSAAWRISRDRVNVVRLPDRRVIEAAVRPYLEALATPSASPDRSAAARLTAMLFPELEAWMPDGTRAVIVPHGILHYLPFEALVDGRGRYLVERAVLSYAPSASSYAFLAASPRPGRPRRGVLAIGNPSTARTSSPAAERTSQLEWVDRLAPLAHAKAEVEAIAAVFGDAAQVLEGARATEVRMTSALPAATAIVHFATHGLVDEEQPDRSGLALTADPPASDGILQMREIYRLRIPSVLVTLSACQTALGKNVTGEGIVGLSRAFFYAGADAVLASLWNVNDAAAAQWMTIVYERLRDGAAIDEAVRAAKLRYVTSGTALAHPYYWAPFVVSGDGSRRVGGVSQFSWTTVALVAGGLLVLATALVRRRRSVTRTRAGDPVPPTP